MNEQYLATILKTARLLACCGLREFAEAAKIDPLRYVEIEERGEVSDDEARRICDALNAALESTLRHEWLRDVVKRWWCSDEPYTES